MIRCLILLLAAIWVDAAEPVPAGLDGLVVAGGEPARLAFSAVPGAVLPWSLSGYHGEPVAAGEAAADAQGRLVVHTTLPAGWYELVLGGGRFGVLALDPALGGNDPDPFFAIDAALAGLVPDAERRGDFARLVRRCGMAMARERLGWAALQPAADRFDGGGQRRQDALRAAWAAAGVLLLEVFHDAPAWLGRSSGAYPARLNEVAWAWSAIGRRWAASTAAVEAWNEPDLSRFSEGGSPEHLAAMTQAVAWGLRQSAPRVLVGGAVLTGTAPPAFRRRLWQSGLLSSCDFISYHDYRDPLALAGHLQVLRGELAAAGEPAMPIWISEAGSPWPGDGGRPAADADARSALVIAMRAVEARAAGVARHFAFVLPFYKEEQRNFGMTGRDGSPLRSLAAYAHLARRLAHLAHVGDLAVPGVRRAHLFAAGARAVAVLWLGDPDPGARFTPPFPLRSAHGLDGRILTRAADGSLPAVDGALLCEVDPALVGAASTASAPSPDAAARRRPALSPVAVLAVPVAGAAELVPQGWRLIPHPDGTVLRVQAWNLAAEAPHALHLRLLPPPGGGVRDGGERVLALAARGQAQAEWRVDPAPQGGTWTVLGECEGIPIRVVLPTWSEPDGAALLARLPPERRRPITAGDLARLDRNLAAGGTLAVEPLADGVGSLAVAFAGEGRWAYPRLAPPADAPLDRFDVLVVKARCAAAADVRVFVHEGAPGYYEPAALFPADGAWHWAVVRLADLVHCPATPADPDLRLDLAAATGFSLGMHSTGPANRLDIAVMELVRLDP